ncbi:translation initiation factor 2 [Mesobacillus boroniphilus JCM 21738]|uniref:Translation initiation factor 2 n=1 Tax=Mesobacillus boroniphilus JCM 21738 TaxID=1294265 RepID=W4RN69_9BACI|nr:translation initiation factor 2 [Mesobacillus boroniphilus JCM 21738]
MYYNNFYPYGPNQQFEDDYGFYENEFNQQGDARIFGGGFPGGPGGFPGQGGGIPGGGFPGQGGGIPGGGYPGGAGGFPGGPGGSPGGGQGGGPPSSPPQHMCRKNRQRPLQSTQAESEDVCSDSPTSGWSMAEASGSIQFSSAGIRLPAGDGAAAADGFTTEWI